MSSDSNPQGNALWQLILMRLRATAREPSVLFWVFIFPIVTSVVLGLAFRNRGAQDVQIAVVDGHQADELSAYLDKADGLASKRMKRAEADELLRKGAIALIVIPGPEPQLVSDPTMPEARLARVLVEDNVNRMRGREDVTTFAESTVTAPGRRYVDFLIPGLLGFGLMSSAIWGLGYALVTMRTGKLLKRLAATPMRRTDFLLSFALSRVMFAVVEVLFFAGFAYVIFKLPIAGSVGVFLGIGLLGSLCFSGLSMLVASRAQNTETANGLMNVVTMPQMVLSGVFFSASNFPEWMQPALRLLPLTALNDALRAVMLEGKGVTALLPQIAVMVVWGIVTFGLAVKWFRWS